MGCKLSIFNTRAPSPRKNVNNICMSMSVPMSLDVGNCSIAKLNQIEPVLCFNSEPINLAELLFKQAVTTKQIV